MQKEKQGKYVPAATPQERSKEDPSALMQDMLKTRDTSGAISEMLEMEASFPERMLDPPLQVFTYLYTYIYICIYIYIYI